MNKGLIVFTALAVLLMAGHFALVITYSFRDNMPAALVRKADRYCVPLFHQNWKLFAPDLPKYNVELEYKIASQGQWSNWADASNGFGFSETSRIETIEQGMDGALAYQVMDNLYQRDGRKQFDRIVSSNEYASALYFVMKLHEIKTPDVKPDSIQLRLHFRFTPPPDKAYTFQESTLEFPVYTPDR